MSGFRNVDSGGFTCCGPQTPDPVTYCVTSLSETFISTGIINTGVPRLNVANLRISISMPDPTKYAALFWFLNSGDVLGPPNSTFMSFGIEMNAIATQVRYGQMYVAPGELDRRIVASQNNVDEPIANQLDTFRDVVFTGGAGNTWVNSCDTNEGNNYQGSISVDGGTPATGSSSFSLASRITINTTPMSMKAIAVKGNVADPDWCFTIGSPRAWTLTNPIGCIGPAFTPQTLITSLAP